MVEFIANVGILHVLIIVKSAIIAERLDKARPFKQGQVLLLTCSVINIPIIFNLVITVSQVRLLYIFGYNLVVL